MATFYGVEQAAEDRRRIKLGPEVQRLAVDIRESVDLEVIVSFGSSFSRRGIRCSPAHEVQTAINADQGTSSHVPNKAIVFNGYVACVGAFSSLNTVYPGASRPVARRRSDSMLPETEAVELVIMPIIWRELLYG